MHDYLHSQAQQIYLVYLLYIAQRHVVVTGVSKISSLRSTRSRVKVTGARLFVLMRCHKHSVY